MNTISAYFSATYTTKRITEHIASKLSATITAFDITNDNSMSEVTLSADDLFVVGIPVYGGRIPTMAAERLKRFKGNGTPAVAIAVYGNRHYDDALLELHDLLSENGFRVVSAGAFIARHSVFSKVAAQRPDSDDFAIFDSFSAMTLNILQRGFSDIAIPGNRPYKIPGKPSIWPSASVKCTSCGKCARLCPTGAIDPNDVRATKKDICIQCGRCIAICPTHSRRFWGRTYSLAAGRFNNAFSQRREPEVFYANTK